MNKIHFVTVFFVPHKYLDGKYLRNIKQKPEGWDSHLYERIRCWGWFKNIEDARKCIKENWTDIYEVGYYNLAMIETIGEGPCPFPKDSEWYTVEYIDGNKYNISKIDKPKLFQNIVGFSFA